MLWKISLGLGIVWLLGHIFGFKTGNLIDSLFLVAIIVVIITAIKGRNES